MGLLLLISVAGVVYAALTNRVRLQMLADLYLRRMILSANAEKALKPLDVFQECGQCPKMVVVPSGDFMMGSLATDTAADTDEFPQHKVTIPEPLAVGQDEITFANWDTCYELGGCRIRPDDYGWGRGNRPVVDVNWSDAQQYVTWLSRQTGKKYRLLTEAEWEYAARAGTTTAYYWGDDVKKDGHAMADCFDCGSVWDDKQTAPVGSFPANAFGLHDTLGNVWEWVQDCYHDSYNAAPSDSSAWTESDCKEQVSRGGSWADLSQVLLRSAFRLRTPAVNRYTGLGFRVARDIQH